MSPILGGAKFWPGGQYGRRRINRRGPLRRGDPSGNNFRRRAWSDDKQALDQVPCATPRSGRTAVVERRLRDRPIFGGGKQELIFVVPAVYIPMPEAWRIT